VANSVIDGASVARCGAALLGMLFLGAGSAAAQHDDKPLPAPALALAPLAGQSIPVVPTTLVVVAPGSENPADYPATRTARVHWADSVLFDALDTRGPDVKWLSPDDLRRVAHRAPAIAPDPDRMGQDLMASDRLGRVPDPLLGYLRTLTALTNSRYVMIPALVEFTAFGRDSVRAAVTFVLADSRGGSVIWRSHPVAVGPTARAALAATVAHILPLPE
jgi:hypothetical protein